MKLRFLTVLTTLAFTMAAYAADTKSEARKTAALKQKVSNIVVIYAENNGFDKLYGLFPGANGIPSAQHYIPQTDRTPEGDVLPTLPATWKGVTAKGQMPVVTEAQSAGLQNAPFRIDLAFKDEQGKAVTGEVITRDLYHRFFENQMQINGGKNDKFAAYSDAGGLTMGHFDGSQMEMWQLAKEYVLADNFFQGIFGGSFSNHQYLICACVPEYPNADQSPAKGLITALETDEQGKYLPRLTLAETSPKSALDGAVKFKHSSNLTPKGYFGDDTFRAINTMQPAYQPSGNQPASTDSDALAYANPDKPTTLPPQTQTTIGDQLSERKVSWAWYGGAWHAALKDGMRDPAAKREVIYTPKPDFQAHHQPFNYYAAFDPKTHADERQQHLKDYDDLLMAVDAGKLPAVTFYKPEGPKNQHPGYANVMEGDRHIAALVKRLQKSPQWKKMVIVVTYDENGGAWDHVAPPKGDLAGPGTRIPAIVISPLAKKGLVDHTQYDTASILRLIARRFDLPELPGVAKRDAALVQHGGVPMGDLTAALTLD
ncbi:acid phosphatase [Burkholderiaceae bacterium DAT-1]|nr:acid phosphatase [Burkholderiaceae bacterium DAT-1]